MFVIDICALTASALRQSACDLPPMMGTMMSDHNPNDDAARKRLDETSRKERINFHPVVFRQLPSDLPSNKNDQIRLLGVRLPLIFLYCFRNIRIKFTFIVRSTLIIFLLTARFDNIVSERSAVATRSN